MRAKKKSHDCVAGMARGELAGNWCKLFSMRRMVSFSLALYTMEGAQALAKEWARRMQFYFDLWFEANLTDFDYSQDMIDMCGDSVEFLDVVLAEEDGGPLWKRALEIRECRPKRAA